MQSLRIRSDFIENELLDIRNLGDLGAAISHIWDEDRFWGGLLGSGRWRLGFGKGTDIFGRIIEGDFFDTDLALFVKTIFVRFLARIRHF